MSEESGPSKPKVKKRAVGADFLTEEQAKKPKRTVDPDLLTEEQLVALLNKRRSSDAARRRNTNTSEVSPDDEIRCEGCGMTLLSSDVQFHKCNMRGAVVSKDVIAKTPED